MALSSGQGPKHSAPSLSRSFLKPGQKAHKCLGRDSCFCDELYLHPIKGDVTAEMGAGLFSLIQLSHMLTTILSPLSKAAGTFPITSPLRWLQASHRPGVSARQR